MFDAGIVGVEDACTSIPYLATPMGITVDFEDHGEFAQHNNQSFSFWAHDAFT
jgi:hypothetical protein